MTYRIQSILVPKKRFRNDKELAKDWILANGFHVRNIDETENFYRFRQYEPLYLKRKYGLETYRTKKLQNGVEFVIAYGDDDEE